jgi:hypothetical protein
MDIVSIIIALVYEFFSRIAGWGVSLATGFASFVDWFKPADYA